MTKVTEAVARPVRSLGQGGAGYVIVDVLDEFTAWEPTTRQYGLAVLVLGAVVSFIQNLGENRGWWKAVLRTVPPVKAEVVDDVEQDPGLPPLEDGAHAYDRLYADLPEQTDNRPRPEDGEQLPDEESTPEEWTGKEMR